MKEYTDFPIEFHFNDFEVTEQTAADLYTIADDTLRDLAKGHTDITGAAIDIQKPAEGKHTDYIYEVSIVVYHRPNNIAATEKHKELVAALKGALKAMVRQVREERARLRDKQQRSGATEPTPDPLPEEDLP